jgi:hypothetical protein
VLCVLEEKKKKNLNKIIFAICIGVYFIFMRRDIFYFIYQNKEEEKRA